MEKCVLKKVVRKQGNSLVLIINKSDKDVYKIEEGDIVEFEIKKVEKWKI